MDTGTSKTSAGSKTGAGNCPPIGCAFITPAPHEPHAKTASIAVQLVRLFRIDPFFMPVSQYLGTGQVAAGPMKTGPMKTGPMKTGPMKTGPMKTGPMKTGPMKTGLWRPVCGDRSVETGLWRPACGDRPVETGHETTSTISEYRQSPALSILFLPSVASFLCRFYPQSAARLHTL